MTPPEILTTVKQAQDLMQKRASLLGSLTDSALGAAGGIGKTMLSYGIPAAVLAPPLLGGIAGAGLAKLTDIDDTDVNEIKSRELVDEYKRQAERLKRQRAIRQYQQARRQSGRMFM
jgi:hypothetical protein